MKFLVVVVAVLASQSVDCQIDIGLPPPTVPPSADRRELDVEVPVVQHEKMSADEMVFDNENFIEKRRTTFVGPYNNIWNNDECKYISRYDGQSLSECKLRCTETPGCTAINFKTTDCVLRACKLPVPEPQWNLPPYHGYKIDKAASCPPGFEQNGIYCYWFSSDRGHTASWPDAQKKCVDLGKTLGLSVHLAEFCYCGSDEWLMRTITLKGEPCYLGAHDPGKNGIWFWVQSGRSLSIDNAFFGPTEPNFFATGRENCLITWKFGNRDPQRQYIGDFPCEHKQHYVCQIFN